MQQKTASTQAPGTQNASKTPLWFGIASILIWALAPFALIWGVMLRGKAARSGRPEPHAQLLVVLGGVGTVLLVGSSIWEAISKDEAPVAKQTADAAQVAPSATANGAAKADAKKAEGAKAEAEYTLKTARELVAARKEVEGEAKVVETNTNQGKLGQARKALDALTSRFGSLERAAFYPDDKDDAATREVLTTAGTLFASFDAARSALETKELVVLTALVPVLRDPKNRAVEPLVLFTQVGKKFGLTGAEVQTIHSVHVEETQRRIDGLDEADRKRLEAKCGSKPERSALDGGLQAVEDFAKKTAHDPGSIDVENCTEPTLSEESCWQTTCEVSGTNAFGGKVRNQVRVSIVKGQAVTL